MQITIRTYRPSDRKGLERCIGLLEDYIALLDPLHRIRILKDFDTKKYVSRSLRTVRTHQGVIYVAADEGNIIGCIVGILEGRGRAGDLEGYSSKDGKILELMVLSPYRKKRIGIQLMKAMETYCKALRCEGIKVECFALNANAHQFYKKQGYVDRSICIYV
ncbi:GNAT family N-acetyltransferase [Candidatus Peregrinibacteria bacterium]|nr:GNAT family N-acetyltransferase [Candidatus Peregrinibacteria bacterium]